MRQFEIKTSKDGQQDIFLVEGDFMEFETDKHIIGDGAPLQVFKMGEEEEPILLASFQFWVYGIDVESQKSLS